MTKLVLDLTKIKNEINIIHNEAYNGVNETNDNKRREILLKVTEKLKSLKTNLNNDTVTLEVK